MQGVRYYVTACTFHAGTVPIHVWVRESATTQQMWSLCVGLIQCKIKQPEEFGLNYEGINCRAPAMLHGLNVYSLKSYS